MWLCSFEAEQISQCGGGCECLPRCLAIVLKHMYFGMSCACSHKRRQHRRGHPPLGTSGQPLSLSLTLSQSPILSLTLHHALFYPKSSQPSSSTVAPTKLKALFLPASKGEGPWEIWEKVQVLWICRGVGVFPSRVIRDEYRN